MAVLFPISLITQYFTNQGQVLSGGLLYVYDAGTTTPRTTFTDSTLAVQNANPHVLDSAGRTTAEFWAAAGVSIKLIVKTSAGVQIGPTLDNIPGLNDTSSASGTGATTVYYAGTSGGSANTLTLTFSNGPSAYTAGNRFVFVAATTNTAAATININGLGAKAIQNRAAALIGGEIVAGRTYEITYTGTAFQMDAVSADSANVAAVASATTTNLDTAGSKRVTLSLGVSPVTAITLTNGEVALVTLSGAVTFTNGASLILPGGSDIVGAAGDSFIFRGEASGVVRCISFTPAASRAMLQGLQTLPIMASSMIPATTNGAGSSVSESATNKVMLYTRDFDQTTSESVQFQIPMPKSWNEGTVTANFQWTADSGTGTVTWGIQGMSLSDDDAIDGTAFGTAQTITDTLLSTDDLHQTATTAAITLAGTPAENDVAFFKVYRDVADTLNADARLISCRIFITYNAGNDA